MDLGVCKDSWVALPNLVPQVQLILAEQVEWDLSNERRVSIEDLSHIKQILKLESFAARRQMVLSLGDVSILLLLNFRSGELALQKRLILGKLREILRKLLLRFHQPKVSKLYWKMIATKWLVSDQELNDFHDSLK